MWEFKHVFNLHEYPKISWNFYILDSIGSSGRKTRFALTTYYPQFLSRTIFWSQLIDEEISLDNLRYKTSPNEGHYEEKSCRFNLVQTTSHKWSLRNVLLFSQFAMSEVICNHSCQELQSFATQLQNIIWNWVRREKQGKCKFSCNFWVHQKESCRPADTSKCNSCRVNF